MTQLQNYDISVEEILPVMNITTRLRVVYTSDEIDDIEDDKNAILSQIRKIRRHNSAIYDNQNSCSLEVVSLLHNRHVINIMVLALTQSGKTGTMLALINNYLQHFETIPIPIENIYIITGLSSIDWVEQTKERMPESIQKRVFHRNELKTSFLDEIKGKKNLLIIMDEIQIASGSEQTLKKVFTKAGFYDKQTLLKKDIKIIEFTATPDGTIYDQVKWKENSRKIKMEPGDGYTSCFDLYDQGRVFQYKDLCGFDEETHEVIKEDIVDNFNELKTIISSYPEPLYHIIRTPNGSESYLVINNFKDFIDKDLKYYEYVGKKGDILKINEILEKKPEKHTFIFIKEKLRCAVTLTKTYLGVVYERDTKGYPHDSSIIQGLVGRMTGYDVESKIIVFTNIKSIKIYKEHWNVTFEDPSIPWNSKTTKKDKDGSLISKGTFNQKPYDDDTSISSEETINKKLKKIPFKEFSEAKKFIKEKFKRNGPNVRKKKEDGFIYATIKGKNKIWSYSELYENEPYIGSSNNDYWFYPCYKDINDKDTLQYLVSWYEYDKVKKEKILKLNFKSKK